MGGPMKQRAIITDFSLGEISPRMGGRLDMGVNQKGAAKISNMIVQEDGGVTKRTGSQFVRPTLDFDTTWGGKRSRIISVIGKGNRPSLIELSDQKLLMTGTDGTIATPATAKGMDIRIKNVYGNPDLTGYDRFFPVVSGRQIYRQVFNNYQENPEVEFEIGSGKSTSRKYYIGEAAGLPDIIAIELYGRSVAPGKRFIIEFSNNGTDWTTPQISGVYKHSPKVVTNNLIMVDGVPTAIDATPYPILENIPRAFIFATLPVVNNSYYIRIKDKVRSDGFQPQAVFLIYNRGKLFITPEFGTVFDGPKSVIVNTCPVSYCGFGVNDGASTGIYTKLDWIECDRKSGNKQADTFTNSSILTTPYTDQDIFELRYIQIDERIIFTHPKYKVQVLDLTAYTFGDLTLTNAPVDLNAGTGKYPAACTYFQGRLYLGGTIDAPSKIWASIAGTPFNFDTSAPADPSNGFFFVLNSQRASNIVWMESKNDLIIGTQTAEWRVTGPNGLVTASQIIATRQTTFGSSNIQGRLINEAIFFIQRDGRRVREYMYSYEQQAYLSPDITQFANHIHDAEIIDVAYSQDPDNAIYCVLANGKITECTYNKSKQVMAWTTWETDGLYESISIISGVAAEDDIFVVVNRYGERFIERFDPRAVTAVFDETYLDSFEEFFDPATTITGLGWLEGREISYTVDGEFFMPEKVIGGEITLQETGDIVRIGIPYISEIMTNKLEDSGIGNLKRIVKIFAKVFRTVGLKAGDGEEQILRIANEQAFDRFMPINEDVEIYYPGGYDKDARVRLIHDYPGPFTLQALQMDYDSN